MPRTATDRTLDVEVSAIRRLRADYLKILSEFDPADRAYARLDGAIEALDRVLAMEHE